MEQDKKRKRAIVFILIAAVLWSLGGLLIKIIDWNPMAIAGMRSGIAGLMALGALFVLGRRPSFTLSFSQVGGALVYCATVILFVTSNKLTTAANAILLQYTAPIYVAMFGRWFLGERTTRFDWLIIAVVLGGMALFFLDSLTPGSFWGNVLAIISGVAFGWFVLFMRKQKKESTFESIILGNGLTLLICLPFMFKSMPDSKSWVGLILLGVFQLGLSYILYAAAIKHMTAIDSILIPTIEPLLNPLWVFLMLKERPGPWALVGGAVILVSITARGLMVARRRPTVHRPPPEMPVINGEGGED
ncbi:MAG: DMT family transporter [Deltaproteobacteria bacterium]|uniref:DMT family transporter n=1 Tax=Candidatus Zymogenus saltonus TaxID=2844893 RepID=A0A9D8KCP4_9DELT|nr:DMT family transporter [Candidatus Zymogenus saltonus]